MGLFKSKDEKMAEALQESILENLNRTSNLVENFSLACADGVVSLSGVCDTPKTRKKAILFAEIAEGVIDVQSGDLTVVETASAESPTQAAEAASETEIPAPAAEADAVSEARTVPGPATPNVESRFYTIKSGDSLSKIAKEFYGDANKYMLIFEANKGLLKDPNKIYPGQEIRIPPLK